MSDLGSNAGERAKRLVVGVVSYMGQFLVSVVAVALLLALAIGVPLLVYALFPYASDAIQWIREQSFFRESAEFVALVATLGGISYVFTKGADGVVRGLKAITWELSRSVKELGQRGFASFHRVVKGRSLGVLKAARSSVGLLVCLLLLSVAAAAGQAHVDRSRSGNEDAWILVDHVAASTLLETVGENGKLETVTISGDDGKRLASVSVVGSNELARLLVRHNEVNDRAVNDLHTIAVEIRSRVMALAHNLERLNEQLEMHFGQLEEHLDRHRDQMVSEFRNARHGDGSLPRLEHTEDTPEDQE